MPSLKKMGFSMLELVIVVVVIGMSVAVALPIYNKAIENSQDRQAIANLKLIKSAQLAYRSEKNHFYGPSEAGPHDGKNNSDEKAINSNLHLNLSTAIPMAWDYYISEADATDFVAKAHRNARGFDRTYRISSATEPTI